MSLSFVMWAMNNFNGQNFAMCGKTVGSFRRNVLFSLKLMLAGRGYKVHDNRTENYCTIRKNGKENYFYIFGGRDERSQDLIQGITLAGLFLDEVVIMPESFVNQATGRCSVDGSKMWFNCNPEGPSHWFKQNWIDKAKDKKLIYLHFTMEDNLSLSPRTKDRYRRMYSGLFYKRFILGLWVLAEGIIYPDYQNAMCEVPEGKADKYGLAVDYGTLNAFACGLWGKYGDIWCLVDIYYYSGRDTGHQMTDKEYGDEIDNRFLKYCQEGRKLDLIVDPSAASFITEMYRRKKYRVIPADNSVSDGIRDTASAMYQGLIKINKNLKEVDNEFSGYIWNPKSTEEVPMKENDHAMDMIRYFVRTNDIVKRKKKYRTSWER